MRDRKSLAIRIRELVEDMEIIQPKITDLEMKKIYKNRHIELLRYIHPNSEYSAAALAYARSEIYRMENGHQKKREWLENILNSSP